LDFNSQVALSRALYKSIQLVIPELFFPAILDMLDIEFVKMGKPLQIFGCNRRLFVVLLIT
jgi:hypothetical protein